MTSQSFNWITALEAAVRTEPSEELWRELEDKASSWPTCACGEACKDLPRKDDDSPEDSPLWHFGHEFYRAVLQRRWPAALAIFHQIEARTAQLLKEQEGK